MATDVVFKRLDIIVAGVGAAPATPANVIVCWELVAQHSGLPETSFRVERSLSPGFGEDEVETIAIVAGVTRQLVYVYNDITTSLIGLWRRYFYRVRAVTPTREFLSENRTWETNPRPHELAIIEDHDLLLKYFTGQPSFAFVERTADSARCPDCWDFSAKRVRSSNCRRCLGTGRERPFFDPIPCYVDFNPDQKITQIVASGERETHGKACWLSAYPMLKPGDILYQIMPGLLWQFQPINTIQPQGTTIQQMGSLQAIDQTNIEYQVLPQRIPQDQLVSVMREWEQIKRERLF